MRTLVILLTLLSSLSSIAKDFSLIPYRQGDKWGYCDKNEKIIIKPKFERSYWFADNGLARVKIKEKYGYIDKSGEIKIEAKFESADDFSFSGALVHLNGTKYCINKEGELEVTDATNSFGCSGLEFAADEESICSNCCEAFEINGEYGIVCKKIDYIENEFKTTAYDSIPAQYDTVYSTIGFSNEFMPLIAYKGNKAGMVDSKNNIVYDFEFDSIRIISYNTFLLKSSTNWTLRDTSNTLYQNITEYKSYIFYSGYYFPVKVKGKWGVLNSKGEEIIPFQFEDILLPSRHIIQREFTIKMNGKWGYISDKGNISPIYDFLEPFNGYQFTLVSKESKEGYIGRDGKEYFEK